MQKRTRQRCHRRIGGDERVRAFEHRLLQHRADPWIIAAKQGAQMPPKPLMRGSRLRNNSLGTPLLYFI